MTAAVFCLATDAAPGRPNEDFVLTSPDLAIVVDGTGVGAGDCAHGVAWYSRQLAAHTMAALVDEPDLPLNEGLARGIHAVARLHVYSCDLTSGTTPCAAVSILRIGAETIDALALSSATVVVDTADGPQIVCDLTIEDLAGTEPTTLADLIIGSPEHQATLDRLVARQAATRNRDGGWWIAASDPQAAYHAATRSYPRASVLRAAAFSDGATRPADQMGLVPWSGYLDLLDKLGPTALIHHVRAIEKADSDGLTHPRATAHDDATIAHAAALTPNITFVH